MQVEFKRDFDEAAERVEAWWRGEPLDRALIKIFAPLKRPSSSPPSTDDLQKWWTDPAYVIPRWEAHMEATYYCGEAMPVMYPVATGMVAILAAYLGCPYKFTGTTTAWADPIIEDWDQPPPLQFDPENEWWRLSAELLKTAAERAPGRYFVGLPDLNGPGEILARLRGTERLLYDVIENRAPLGPALNKLNLAWRRYYEACLDIVHRHVPGSICWMGIWSNEPSTDLQCDFSCMISPAMFNDLFLAPVQEQTEWVDRTIYHLDGPEAIRHLDSILALPLLSGIQWEPGAGARPMSRWVELLNRILRAGKLLYIYCDANEVEGLLKALPHQGLLMDVKCESHKEADALLANVARWSR